jgi:hypothetical protein
MAGAGHLTLTLDTSKLYEDIDNLPEEILDRLAAKVAERLPKPVEAVLDVAEPAEEYLASLADRLAPLVLERIRLGELRP